MILRYFRPRLLKSLRPIVLGRYWRYVPFSGSAPAPSRQWPSEQCLITCASAIMLPRHGGRPSWSLRSAGSAPPGTHGAFAHPSLQANLVWIEKSKIYGLPRFLEREFKRHPADWCAFYRFFCRRAAVPVVQGDRPSFIKFVFWIFLHVLSNPSLLPSQLQEDIALFLQLRGADPGFARSKKHRLQVAIFT